MKNWTKTCQEIAYARSGKVFVGGQWIATSDRGLAVMAMAASRSDVSRTLKKVMSAIRVAANYMREQFVLFQRYISFIAEAPPSFLGKPSHYNYASALLESKRVVVSTTS